jgi:hypothetical protein
MDQRRSYVRNYPRSPGAELLDAEGVLGFPELAALTGRSLAAAYKWAEHRVLPYADGPVVWNKRTWQRSTILAWAYANGFSLNANKAALPCHEEAEHWHGIVPAETIRRVADVEGSEAR